MGFLDKIGLRKKSSEAPAAKKETEAVAKVDSTEKKAEPQKKADTGSSYQILLRPFVSEKAMGLAGFGKYVFVVHPKANKSEIRKSIQKVYDVHVTDVKIIKLPSKKRRYGRAKGQTSAIKKALVTLRAGEKIPGIIEQVG